MAAPGPGVTPTPTPPTSGITPIKNGKLITPLDANGFAILNLDITGSGITGGGGGGGSGLASITGDDGSATGLTLAISHTTGSNLTDPIFTLGSTLAAAHGGTGFTSLSLLKSGMALNLVDNTTDASKPISTATQTALDLKLASADLAAFTGSTNIVTLGTIATGTWSGTALVAGKVPALNAITAPAADVSLNSHKITNLADPTGATDGVNKQYADAVAAGGVPHAAAATASTNNRSLSGEQTIDGVLTSTSRVLLKNQTTAKENGIYVTAAGAWSRATDADADAEISGSVFISGGTVNAGTTWALTTPQPITLDTTALAYTQTGANTIYSATGGITLTGSQFSLTPAATLTLKGNNTGGTAAPTDLSYSTVKSALALNNVENTALSTWAGSTNITTLGTIATGVIPPARIQGITTVGTNFVNSLGTPGNASFPRINSNGTLTERTFSETLGDIGGQTAISVTSPLALTIGGALSIPAATDLAAGHLSASDHNAFTLKVPPGRTITTTAPLRISTSTTPLSGAPGSDLSANRTIDMPAATSAVDGFMTKEDRLLFFNKTPPDSQVNFSNNGTTTTPATWTTGATAAYETAGITTSDKYAFLPPSTSYAPGKRITYTDPSTGGNFGRFFRPATASGDFINNSTSDFKPFIAGQQGAFGRKSVEFEAVTASAGVFAGWQVVTASSVFHVEDPSTAAKQFTFDASLQNPLAPGVVTAAAGNSVTVVPSTGFGFLTDITGEGAALKAIPTQTEIAHNIYKIGTIGTDFGFPTVSVTTGSSIDTIEVLGNVVAPLTIKIPAASDYADGDVIMLVDTGGTVSSSHPVNVTSTNGTDTFNYSSAFSWEEGFGRKSLTSDGGSNWHVSITKATIQPYKLISRTGTNYTIVCDPNAVEQHSRIVLGNGANNLFVSGASDGMKFDIWVKQPASGAAGTLTLPIGSTVGSSGLGVITLSSVNDKKDHLTAAYDGNDSTLNFNPVIVDYSTSATPTAPSALGTSGITANKIVVGWTDNASNESGFALERCAGASCSNFAEIAGPTAGSPIAVNATSYTDTGVVNATSYTYRLRAFNAGGYSSYSSSTTASTLSGGPTAEIWELHLDDNTGATTTATIGPNGNLTYSTDWTTSSLQSGAPNVSALNLVAGMANVGSPSVTVVGTGGTSTYSYRVAAWKTSPNLRTGAVQVTTGANAFAALDGTHLNRVSWSSVTGADYYEIYRQSSNGSPSTIGRIGTVTGGSGTITFDDTGLPTNGPIPNNITTPTDFHGLTAASTLNYDPNSNAGKKISVSFWAKSTFSSTTNVKIIDGINWNIQMTNPNKLFLSMNRATGTVFTGTVALNVSSGGNNINSGTGWHLIVVEFDNSTGSSSATNIQVYYDAGAVAQTTTPVTSTGIGPQTFAPSAPIIGNNLFAGAIDDVRIYDHALDATERSNLFTGDAQ